MDMTPTTPFDRTALRVSLDELVGNHGLWPVLRALVARLFRRRPLTLSPGLNVYLQRDIGLEPLASPLDGPR
jgi:hypothetical protein